MRKLLAALVTTAASVAVIATAAPASAYPGCYYGYGGCYLVPGWYDGRYWGGGPWWGWNGYGPVAPPIGCPVPYVNGICGG